MVCWTPTRQFMKMTVAEGLISLTYERDKALDESNFIGAFQQSEWSNTQVHNVVRG